MKIYLVIHIMEKWHFKYNKIIGKKNYWRDACQEAPEIIGLISAANEDCNGEFATFQKKNWNNLTLLTWNTFRMF
jgi:hypothetical protein